MKMDEEEEGEEDGGGREGGEEEGEVVEGKRNAKLERCGDEGRGSGGRESSGGERGYGGGKEVDGGERGGRNGGGNSGGGRVEKAPDDDWVLERRDFSAEMINEDGTRRRRRSRRSPENNQENGSEDDEDKEEKRKGMDDEDEDDDDDIDEVETDAAKSPSRDGRGEKKEANVLCQTKDNNNNAGHLGDKYSESEEESRLHAVKGDGKKAISESRNHMTIRSNTYDDRNRIISNDNNDYDNNTNNSISTSSNNNSISISSSSNNLSSLVPSSVSTAALLRWEQNRLWANVEHPNVFRSFLHFRHPNTDSSIRILEAPLASLEDLLRIRRENRRRNKSG